ncbi:site-specific integrase [Bosea sp. ANAM02]|uniref:site-specific integrase n=1 Tax=Bosea sp. ANAM02 TaxID=2020412 RepID=UPI00140EF0F8|nr:site-specific integrase [Bosea sp. ANAM02]BCB18307.1 hypothetical protein OCUBac02_12010 [Bosea sp. ANAM02]
MSRPWKHPKTGIYWLRKRVPDDLQKLVGKREEKQSLGTRDPAEAKRKHLAALTEVEERWANLKVGPRTLTEREAHELAQPQYDEWLALHRDFPSQQPWSIEIGAMAFDPNAVAGDLWWEVREHRVRCIERANARLMELGVLVDEKGQLALARAIAGAYGRASLKLKEWAKGDFGIERPVHVVMTAGSGTGQPVPVLEPISFKDLIKSWSSENDVSPRTLYNWTGAIERLKKFVGHDNAVRLTPDEMVRWKTALIDAGLKPKTIRDAYLAPVRAILGVAVKNKRLPSNPAEGITIGVKAKPGATRRGYSDDEAKTVLKAAEQETDPVRRWVPWLCAYSGARVAEICQLRVEDVFEVGGVWSFKVDPAAGRVKTLGSERSVPLHPALIEAGFLKFKNSVKKGPLFASLTPDRFGSRGGNGTKVLSRWVRSLGLDDPRLAPNHSWRHRMRTLARRHALDPDTVDKFIGHAGREVPNGYGEFEAQVAYREISKIPTLKLD